jgi:gamma-glutamylcyclotransferase (GGCT)/AIG2-like uncharacterized protein YtfP
MGGTIEAGVSPLRLFVYGSLMGGFFNYEKVLAGKVLSRRRAIVRGKLFHQIAKGYPALVPGSSPVAGEFLELLDFDRLLADSDRLENFFGPGQRENEYERRPTPVELGDTGVAALAWVYWYARDDLETETNPAIFLSAGDWRRYMEEAGYFTRR